MKNEPRKPIKIIYADEMTLEEELKMLELMRKAREKKEEDELMR